MKLAGTLVSEDQQESVMAFRLRSVDGEQDFLLGRGVHRVGNARSNDVVLPFPSVSRRHALLAIGTDHITVDDLASKNGTHVRGNPVSRARLGPGDEIRFGEVLLRLEAVEAKRSALAIRLPDIQDPSSLSESPETSGAPIPGSHSGQRDWAELIDRFLERLSAVKDPDLGGALGVLIEELPCAGSAIVELTSSGDLVAVASAGRPHPLDRTAAGLADMAAGIEPGRIGTAYLDDPAATSVALMAGPDARALAVVIRGDFPDRPWSPSLLRSLVRIVNMAWEGSFPGAGRECTRAPRQLVFPAGFIHGVAPASRELQRQMRLVCGNGVPVLIQGETGVGKEQVARVLHASSGRGGPFIALNCAAIPADLLEAELFGIAKGVATGVSARHGKFQLADGGTLLLDEIGETPRELQAKLLRVLQEREVQPLGGQSVPIDVDILSATNMDLAEQAQQGAFRADLYYRLAGVTLEVPPLRRRREDIPLLLEYFLRRFSEQLGKRVRGVTVGALEALTAYAWPGNVRELEHESRRLVMLCPYHQPIHEDMLPPYLREVNPGPDDDGATLEQIEKRAIRDALEQCGGNQVKVAALLGISRYSLRRRMERHGLGASGGSDSKP